MVLVIKFKDWDGRPNPNLAVHHLYTTGNHPFWAEGTGWTAAEKLRCGNRLRLVDGRTAEVDKVWPILRTPLPGVGWVSADTIGNYDGLERAHVVDFRNGCNLWQYPMFHRDQAGVPYCEGMGFGNADGLFNDIDFCDIVEGVDPYFKARVFSLEIEDFHTCYVGELGVWAHGTSP